MAHIFLVRHAESQANARGIYQGQSYDTLLSPAGLTQARLLAERLKQYPIGQVICSPLTRAVQTAATIAHQLQLKYSIEPLLMETNHGEWEGQKIEDICSSPLWQTWRTAPSETVFPAGEAFSQTASRVIDWWNSKFWEKDTVVVTHDNIIQALVVYLQGISLDRIWDFSIPNTSVTLIESTPEHKIVYIGDTSHL